jgi:hypothetical protein
LSFSGIFCFYCLFQERFNCYKPLEEFWFLLFFYRYYVHAWQILRILIIITPHIRILDFDWLNSGCIFCVFSYLGLISFIFTATGGNVLIVINLLRNFDFCYFSIGISPVIWNTSGFQIWLITLPYVIKVNKKYSGCIQIQTWNWFPSI